MPRLAVNSASVRSHFDGIQADFRLEISPLALSCYLSHCVPSLVQAGIAYHPVRIPGATSIVYNFSITC